MSALLKFITIMQKILIAICILCFIPTSIFIFAPKDIQFNTNNLLIYNRAYQQVYSSFFISVNDASACSYREMVLNSQYCLRRAQVGKFGVRVVTGVGKCEGWGYQYDGLQFCSGVTGTVIYNKYQQNITNGITQTHSNLTYPIFKILPPISSPSILYYHYVPSATFSCPQLSQTLTQNPQLTYSMSLYKPYRDSSQLLWFQTIPLLVILLVLIITNQITDKYNFRKYILMACFCINVSLITLIIKGAIFFSEVGDFAMNLLTFSKCFVGEEKEKIADMSGFDNGVGFGFLFFMGIVALLIFLSVVGQLLARLLQMKYYSSRDQPEEAGVQLSSLKTSLRSRQIKQSDVAQSRHKPISIQYQ